MKISWDCDRLWTWYVSVWSSWCFMECPLPCWIAVRACKGFKFQRTMEETSKFQMNTSLCIRAGKSDENHIHRYIQRYSSVFAWFTTRMAINSITINLYIWLAKLQNWSLKKNINIYDYNYENKVHSNPIGGFLHRWITCRDPKPFGYSDAVPGVEKAFGWFCMDLRCHWL